MRSPNDSNYPIHPRKHVSHWPMAAISRPIVYIDRYIYVDIPRHYFVPSHQTIVVDSRYPYRKRPKTD
ncbi:hypothetical protein [Alicyclobacillus acidoterrestris]|uniref:Uncharacterized protein n=1 Tax=Alicyclobacillus acidoterrestris (strain ATCC 49025 / DSM 3922 / CIP 106132 / NCIMB 13137 / GD3B) TaxID=1356854 RepID=T0CKB7_ALIAG|nr:hypothetical protein [Alicyclobacillus acidoterrestris]EPZ52950.1 hypothetical protein N007_18975 [Alicyclobacillus acidoterrestris ATCC 49025]UNO48102.1 hypothetical protein K1I37_15645 [Alicyclobacillus acidoterrestris]